MKENADPLRRGAGIAASSGRPQRRFISAYDFDFVIGSTHLCKGMDPYYPEYFEKFSSEEEAIRAYFAETLENLKCHDDYDVLGHLDYIVRVAPTKDKNYSYDKYKDAIDPILEL